MKNFKFKKKKKIEKLRKNPPADRFRLRHPLHGSIYPTRKMKLYSNYFFVSESSSKRELREREKRENKFLQVKL